jgi:hypothetical protein
MTGKELGSVISSWILKRRVMRVGVGWKWLRLISGIGFWYL